MAAAELRVLLNGPVVAGVGATVDAGLATDKFHVLPWDPKKRIVADIIEGKDGLALKMHKSGNPYKGNIEDLLKYASWNVASILNIDAVLAKAATATNDFKANLRNDMIAIVFLQLAYGYYHDECRVATTAEKKAIDALVIPETARSEIINVNRLNRAATFILARMHTKYQTNHAIGGTPMQASIASSVRAFYGVSPSSARSPSATALVSTISDCLYWAVHPANETLLIPAVIENTGITKTEVHANGPEVTFLAVEEYFAIRAKTPPAATHHFYTAAAAIKLLDPLGLLPYLPDPNRTKDVLAGLKMIASFGARLHPAARYWGLDRLSANQKLVETICSDLGYAVRKLMPASSLAASPILAKEDGLDASWKALVDALRAAMDDRGKELLDRKIFEEIKQSIAPTAKELAGVKEIKGYLTSGRVEEIEETPGETHTAATILPPATDSEGESDEETRPSPARPTKGKGRASPTS